MNCGSKSSRMYPGDTLSKQTIWIGTTVVFIALSEFIFVPIFTKLFGSRIYGIWVTYITIIQLITPISLLGLENALIRFMAGNSSQDEIRENFYSILTMVFCSSLVLSFLVSFILGHLPSKIFGDSIEVRNFVKFGSFLIFSWAIELIALNYYRTFRKVKKYAVLTIIQISLEICAVLFITLRGYTLILIAYSFIAIRFFIFMLCFTGISKEIGIKIPHFINIKRYLSFGAPIMVSPILIWVVKLSDRLLIRYFLRFEEVGIYSAAYNIANVITLFLLSFQTALSPEISALWNRNNFEKVKEKLSLTFKYFFLFAIPSCFVLLVLSKEFLRIFTKPGFIESGYLVIPIVAFAIVFYGIYLLSTNVLKLAEKPYIITITLGFGASINIILNVLLIPRMGILGAAVATLIAFVFMALAMVLSARKYVRFDLNMAFVAKAILSSGIMALILRQLRVSNLSTFIFALFIGIIVYGTIIFLLKGITRNEVKVLKNSILSSRNNGKEEENIR